jgi:hypothetical protein
VCYLTRRFITVFTGIRHFFLSWARLIQSTLFPFYSCTPVPTAAIDHFNAASERAGARAFWQCRPVGRPAAVHLCRGRPESKDRSHATRCCQNASNSSRVWLGSFWTSSM